MNIGWRMYGLAIVLGLGTEAFANRPAPQPPDVCNPVRTGETIVEARIVSFEQPRYTCGISATQGGIERLTPDSAATTTGCIAAQTEAVHPEDLRLDEPSPGLALDHSSRPYVRTPVLIELRVDGVPRTVRYVDGWQVCGLTPGHHVIEMDTARGALRCEGDVGARATLTLEARSSGAMLHIEPTRVVAGAPLLMQRHIVEYDELNFAPHAAPRPRYDGFPPSMVLRVWKTRDGVMRAQRCPPPPTTRPPAPRTAPARACAHCGVGAGDRSQSMVVSLLVLTLILRKRRA